MSKAWRCAERSRTGGGSLPHSTAWAAWQSFGALFDQSLAIMQELNDRRGIATVLNNLGDVAWHAGDDESARPLYDKSLAIGRELGDRWGMATNLLCLGDMAQHQGDNSAARSLYAQCLATNWELRDRGRLADALDGLAGLAAAEGRPERALRLAGAAANLRGSFGSPRFPVEQEQVALWLAPAHRALQTEAGMVAWAEGHAMSAEQAVDYALRPAETEPSRARPLVTHGLQ